jgi:hypothetical protein
VTASEAPIGSALAVDPALLSRVLAMRESVESLELGRSRPPNRHSVVDDVVRHELKVVAEALGFGEPQRLRGA